MSSKIPEILEYLPSRVERFSPQIPTHPPLHKIFRYQKAGSCAPTFGDLGKKSHFGGQELDSKQLTGAQPLLHVRNLPTERRVFAFLPWLPGSPELNLEEKEVILDYPMYTASLHWGPEIQSFLSARDYSNKSL